MLKKFLLILILFMSNQTIADYSPFSMINKVSIHDITINDELRNREIPIRIYLPDVIKPAPLILYSHGLGGARTNNQYIGDAWASRGYIVVFMQHLGSDEAVWQGKPMLKRLVDMKLAANKENFILRTQDVKATIDNLLKWNLQKDNLLFDKIDANNIGMSGHSFGAVTTQAVSGQKLGYGFDMNDNRIKAAIAMSPSLPIKNNAPEKTFEKVNIPWCLMTGTNDNSPIGSTTAETRAKVYDYLPEGNKYQLILYKAEHSAFGDRALPNEKEQRNPKHHGIIIAISNAFWDAYLRHDEQANKWLKTKTSEVLQENDLWQYK
jgi:predicted dienelactone hydrolase